MEKYIIAKKYRGKLRAVYGGSSAAGRDNIPLSALKGMTPKQHCEKLIAEASKNSNLKGYFKEESVGEDVCMLPHANYFGGGYLAPVYSYYYDVCEEIELTIKINDKVVSSMQTHRLKGGERVIITANQSVTWQANATHLEKVVLNEYTYSFTAPKKISNFLIKAIGKCDPKASKFTQFIITPCTKIALNIKVNNVVVSAAQMHKLKGGDKVVITANQNVTWKANPIPLPNSLNAKMYSFTASSQPTNITITATSECDPSASEVTTFSISPTKKKFEGFGSQIDSYIHEAAQKFNINEKDLRGFIKMEGGWTGEISPTGAIGAGQFTRDTWHFVRNNLNGKSFGMEEITDANFRTPNDPRFNSKINILATARYAKYNKELLQKNNLPTTGVNLYLMHNIGQGVMTALKGSNKVTERTLKSMKNNNKMDNETPVEFVKRQGTIFQQHYELANSQ